MESENKDSIIEEGEEFELTPDVCDTYYDGYVIGAKYGGMYNAMLMSGMESPIEIILALIDKEKDLEIVRINADLQRYISRKDFVSHAAEEEI